ncbi:hypothetical protein H5410_050128 [Solanum commersonii]|uniref:Uncharacterized protein n=1 Tax=Solanum commersonii TaxID=4109 RepID=A0A9J5WW63_SOLCO|nr:hypothetical protein H5410_050128 [Solanum commersonii]
MIEYNDRVLTGGTCRCLTTAPNSSAEGAWNSQGWNLSFRRQFNDWEIGSVAEMLKVLKFFHSTRNVENDG